ncbi:CHAT domain-containing protein [Streptosporangiaceae bacterium NEAU-GS5]|nr:CHAT domain-containing protein [Streptosporangiaceae bacterium NEAU-GS5]
MDNAGISRLDDYVRAYEDQGESGPLLSDAALADAARSAGNLDTTALRTLARFFWTRYMAQGDFADLAPAVDASDALAESDPPARPPVLAHALDYLDGHEPELLTGGEDASWAGLIYGIGTLSAELVVPGGDPKPLGRTIRAMAAVLDLIPPDHPGRLSVTVLLGRHLSVRGHDTGNLDDLRAAAGLLREALAMAPATHPLWPSIHVFLISVLADTYRLEDTPAGAVAFGEATLAALAAIPAGHPDRETIVAYARSMASSPHFGDLRDMDETIALADVAVATRPPGDPQRPGALYILGHALGMRAAAHGSAEDGWRAIEALREMTSIAAEPVDRVLSRSLLSLCMAQQFAMTGQAELLPEAVAAATEAVELGPPPEFELYCLLNLGTALSYSYQECGRRDQLELLIDRLSPAELDSADGSRGLYVLAAAYYSRFQLDGTRDDLEKGIEYGRRALAVISEEDPSLSDALGNLANALRLRTRLTGSSGDLDEAVALERKAMRVTPAERGARAGVCLNLGGVLRERYTLTGSADDLDEAVAVLREAVDRAREGSPTWQLSQSTLGAALGDLHLRSGDRAKLDESITRLRMACDSMREGNLERPQALNNLGAGLQQRFELTGSSADLDEAIAAYRGVLAATAPAGPQHLQTCGNLGSVLESRYWRTRDRADLDEAVALLRRAEAATGPGDHNRPVILTNLAKALSTRYLVLDDLDDLDRAVESARLAFESLPPEAERRARYLSGWGSLRATRAQRRGDAAELDAAIAILADDDAAIPLADPNRVMMLTSWGDALLARHRRTGSAADYTDAQRLLRQAAAQQSGPARARLRAARMWAAAAGEAGDMAAALDGLAAAIGLMPLAAWRGIPRGDQESQLAGLSWLAADAAALAVEAGRPRLAVELSEHGRGVLWAQLLETRGDLGRLREVRPDLADRLDALRSSLERDLDDQATADRAGLARAWDEAVDEVRALPGFGDFLRAPKFAELATAAAEGPVVVINVSSRRCDALIIADGDVTVCPLPGLDARDVVERANALLGTFTAPPTTLGEAIAAHQRMGELLGWLGAAVTTPVLRATGPVRRIWWCPTGPLALLPVHAGADAEAGVDALDQVVSSYTPTLRALIDARVRPRASSGPRRTLLVAMEHTPGAPDLVVRPEIEALTELLGDRCTTLENAAVADVRAHLDGHPWVHLACHGVQNPGRPSLSGIALSDGVLSVLDIAALRLPGAELAFLSACQTAAIDGTLTDEAIHLAAALQITGFPSVIATLWPVYDRVAPQMARFVYEGLAGQPGAAKAAELLNQATRRVRDDGNTALPGLWAPYIHIGA